MVTAEQKPKIIHRTTDLFVHSMLSPYYRRTSVTVSVSGGPGIDYWSYLLDVDAILRQYGARPHWGKLHFSRAEDMPSLYPRFHDFQAIRPGSTRRAGS
jgi:hypothetical protein